MSASPQLESAWQALFLAAEAPPVADWNSIRASHKAFWDDLGASDAASLARCETVDAPVPLCRVLPEAGSPNKGAVMVFHGGGWAMGSACGESVLLCAIADQTGREVFSADYRLLPEHVFPAQVDDAVEALVFAAGQNEDLLVAGCSAGGHLAVAGSLALRDRHPEAFRALTGLRLMSPGTDLRPDAAAWQQSLASDWVKPGPIFAQFAAFLQGADPNDPLASPLLADLRGLPPTRIQVGAGEGLAIDNRAFAAALKAAGVPVELEEIPGVPHGIHLLPKTVPEGRAALERLFDRDRIV